MSEMTLPTKLTLYAWNGARSFGAFKHAWALMGKWEGDKDMGWDGKDYKKELICNAAI